jgi:NadR type nicotinamide-nucleotide adenylyltransferase
MKESNSKRFVIVGVESTGKSSCAEFLTENLNATLITEYAREYLEINSNEYSFEDFQRIAIGQKNLEDTAFAKQKGNEILILDTDFIVIYIWSKIVYGFIEEWIIERLNSYDSRVYFLMSPDVAWVNDGLREYPDLQVRRAIHQQYVEALELFKCEYHLITGNDHSHRQNEVLNIIKTEYLSPTSV